MWENTTQKYFIASEWCSRSMQHFLCISTEFRIPYITSVSSSSNLHQFNNIFKLEISYSSNLQNKMFYQSKNLICFYNTIFAHSLWSSDFITFQELHIVRRQRWNEQTMRRLNFIRKWTIYPCGFPYDWWSFYDFFANLVCRRDHLIFMINKNVWNITILQKRI